MAVFKSLYYFILNVVQKVLLLYADYLERLGRLYFIPGKNNIFKLKLKFVFISFPFPTTVTKNFLQIKNKIITRGLSLNKQQWGE